MTKQDVDKVIDEMVAEGAFTYTPELMQKAKDSIAMPNGDYALDDYSEALARFGAELTIKTLREALKRLAD